MNPQISIIIPVYNGEASISIALDSVIKQTYSNFEVIIVDDGSVDNTSKLIERYSNKDKRVKYIYQQNAGVAIARNKGLGNAAGKYICFLDADDYHDNTFLERMYSKITEKDYDICYCGYKVVTPHKISKRRSGFKQGEILIDYVLGKIAVNTSGWLIKSELIKRNNVIFPEGVSWGEDIEFFCEVLAHTDKIIYIKDYLTNYRFEFNENQLSVFTMDKLDKDYESIKRLQNNRSINKNSQIDRALDYRLSALLTYRLVRGLAIGIEFDEVYEHFNKYKEYIVRFTWNNGLRSVKLNLNKLKLLYLLRHSFRKRRDLQHE